MTALQWIVGFGWFGLTLSALGHALLTKRDVRASIGWVGLILVFPLVGPILYYLFGINLIRRRARGRSNHQLGSPASARRALRSPAQRSGAFATIPSSRLAPLAFLVGQVARRPLVKGNSIEILVNGEQAYPAMLEALATARRSITLSSYIFDWDAAGERFVAELEAACARGLEVRVLIDSVGGRYSSRPVVRILRRKGVRAASFLPGLLPLRWPYFNLRTHRKILVVDGETAFVGGMNIRQGHLVESASYPVQDVHFRVSGPVVSDTQGVFAGDWAFTTRERLEGDLWFPDLSPTGKAKARVLPDGPDEDLDQIRWTLLGALANARDSVRIQTPYFLPDNDLIVALQLAALRGVEVEVLLPAQNNLKFVAWASIAQWGQLLEHGCRIYLGEPPFDHSKLMTVDGLWALVGSANWDPRSLRLNFEIDLEIYDTEVAREIEALFERRRARARRVDARELASRPLWRQLRDGAARLALPYL